MYVCMCWNRFPGWALLANASTRRAASEQVHNSTRGPFAKESVSFDLQKTGKMHSLAVKDAAHDGARSTNAGNAIHTSMFPQKQPTLEPSRLLQNKNKRDKTRSQSG